MSLRQLQKCRRLATTSYRFYGEHITLLEIQGVDVVTVLGIQETHGRFATPKDHLNFRNVGIPSHVDGRDTLVQERHLFTGNHLTEKDVSQLPLGLNGVYMSITYP